MFQAHGSNQRSKNQEKKRRNGRMPYSRGKNSGTDKKRSNGGKKRGGR